MLRKVHQIYGATGATFAKAMNEGQSTIGNTLWTNEHVRNAAQSAATQAAQHTVQVILGSCLKSYSHGKNLKLSMVVE